MNFLDVFQLMLALFIPMIIGFFMYKMKLVDKGFIKGISLLLYNVTLPCSILDSMLVKIPLSELKKSIVLPVSATIIILVTFVISLAVARMIEKDKKNFGIVSFAFMFPNFTYTAYPILEKLYNKEAVFYASIFNLAMFLGVLTIGVYVVKKSSVKNVDCSFSLKDLFSIPLFALILGFLLLFVPFEMPAFVKTTASMLGAMTTPLGVLLIGMVLASSKKLDFKKLKLYVVALVRLIVIPVSVLYILKFLGFSGHYIYVPVIILSNPIAVNLVVLSSNFDANEEVSASYVLVTSILSIVTIPLISLLL